MKIFCIGRNYADHAKEMNSRVPDRPIIFMKPPTALVKDHRPFYYPEFSKNIHFECEIVLRISQAGKCIDHENALNFIDKITLGIDYTARDLQAKCKENGHPWEIAKAFDFSAPIGDLKDFRLFQEKPIEFHLEQNGIIVQKGSSNDLIFSFTDLIVYLSKFFTLKRGDLIFTGTPSGVASVKKGDILEGFLMGEKVLLSIVK